MYDVAIIGGGVCGCSLLYQLSRYKVNAVLLEKENDVGVATTKANSAIVHAGFDPDPGTLMAKYNVEGNALIEQLCRDLDILYKKPGSLVLAFTNEERIILEGLLARGKQNGVPGMEIVERERLLQMEPQAGLAICALYAPSTGIVNPWELASAQAEAAVSSGANVLLNCEVVSIAKQNGFFKLETGKGTICAKYVVSAAGVNAGAVCSMLEPPSYKIHPNRGQYFLLDKSSGGMVNHVVFQCPTKEGKGVLVSPTVHGNLIVGPDSAPCQPNDTSTTAQNLEFVRKTALKSVPGINFRDSIRNFSGIRAASDHADFIVHQSQVNTGFFEIAGIKSPGLTAAPAIAKAVVSMLHATGLSLEENPAFVSKRKITRFRHLSPQQRAQVIKENPAYGTIVCRCETVTEGEIIDALHRPLPPRSLDGVKRRCGPGMGRCQGGFCGPRVQAIISRELGIPMQDIPLDREGTYIITGVTKSGEAGKND